MHGSSLLESGHMSGYIRVVEIRRLTRQSKPFITQRSHGSSGFPSGLLHYVYCSGKWTWWEVEYMSGLRAWVIRSWVSDLLFLHSTGHAGDIPLGPTACPCEIRRVEVSEVCVHVGGSSVNVRMFFPTYKPPSFIHSMVRAYGRYIPIADHPARPQQSSQGLRLGNPSSAPSTISLAVQPLDHRFNTQC